MPNRKSKWQRKPRIDPDSRCLMCARIFYGKVYERCPRCGGFVRIMPLDELQLSSRRTPNEHSVVY